MQPCTCYFLNRLQRPCISKKSLSTVCGCFTERWPNRHLEAS